jgi:16S rRNA (guanine527-N7)-methyltransferase
MDKARIATLLEPFLQQPLAPSQLNQISTYIDLLQRWNARINLTAIRNEEEIVTRHFGESLFMARHLFPTPIDKENCHPERGSAMSEAHGAAESKDPFPTNPAGQAQPTVIDIGSGAGFPAIPLKIWAPQIHLTMIESNHKKSAFLKEVARALTLADINIITDRAETVAETGLKADIVTLRAVEHFESILPQATKLASPTGTLALLIGKSQLPALSSFGSKAIRLINIQQSHSRIVVLVEITHNSKLTTL